MMNLIGWWKSRHNILKSETLDDIDELASGKIFKIRYLGCSHLDPNEECDFKKAADGILLNLTPSNIKKVPTLELFIDSQSLAIVDKNSTNPILLETQLADIREIFYRKNDCHYGKICIFVARHMQFSTALKAHVLYCDSFNTAEEVFNTFSHAFKVLRQNEGKH